jgi:hypothetical protein
VIHHRQNPLESISSHWLARETEWNRAFISLHPDVPASVRYPCSRPPHTYDSVAWHVGSLPNTPLHFFLAFFLDPLFRAILTPVLVFYWFARWSCGSPAVSFCPTASQWELRLILPFPSCFLHNPKFRPADYPACFHVGTLLCLCLALKMVPIWSSETSVGFQRTTWRYIPEDSTLYSHRCENLKSYDVLLFLRVSSYKEEPFTVAARSKAWTVFACSNAGIVGSNPTQSMDVCLHLFYVYGVLRVGSGLATG